MTSIPPEMKDVMIWPIYLDAGKSLNEGRKISKEYAISEPRIKEIVKATQKLRYKYYAEEDKAYPGEWDNKSGNFSSLDLEVLLSNCSQKIRKYPEEEDLG